jgi:hypothetical protein
MCFVSLFMFSYVVGIMIRRVLLLFVIILGVHDNNHIFFIIMPITRGVFECLFYFI